MAEFVMPILGADMTEGALVEWRVVPGETVRKGQILAVVETDKGSIEIESFHTGTLERLLAEPGAKVPVGTALAIVREAGEAPAAAPSTPVPSAPASQAPVQMPATSYAPVPPSPSGTRAKVTPLARKLAAQWGVDLAQVTGTGPGGAIRKEDIEQAAAAKPEGAKEIPSADPAARMRKAIAAAMSKSKREIPHYYLSHTLDLNASLDWLAQENAKREVTRRLLHGVLLLKAVALALRKVPEMNASWANGQVVIREDIHAGVAIALRQGGLIAPAIHHTDRLSLDELMTKFLDLVQRARGGGLRGSELSDPTITVTSLGEQGVEAVWGVIQPPQACIVGFGKVAERPWVVNGEIVARPLVTATLSADHRVSDGHRGGRFLAWVEKLLQEPGKL